jgi:hypothetical protein
VGVSLTVDLESVGAGVSAPRARGPRPRRQPAKQEKARPTFYRAAWCPDSTGVWILGDAVRATIGEADRDRHGLMDEHGGGFGEILFASAPNLGYARSLLVRGRARVAARNAWGGK